MALNCVANGRILRECGLDDIWIQPAAGDAGGALGAALAVWHQYLTRERQPRTPDAMRGAYLGPAFSEAEITTYLGSIEAPFRQLEDAPLFEDIARILDDGKVVGWFQGRMEFGPRALGGRSIIGDPRNEQMQSTMNLKIKYRESFRPFAPSVLYEREPDYFEQSSPSPYMLLVAPVNKEIRTSPPEAQRSAFGLDKLHQTRSQVPAITHVDYSARIQTVHSETNPRYHAMIRAFEERTGCGAIVNTSFNVRGEPIVCTPEDAYRCFMRTEMDYLVLENFILCKEDQPEREKSDKWKEEFVLD